MDLGYVKCHCEIKRVSIQFDILNTLDFFNRLFNSSGFPLQKHALNWNIFFCVLVFVIFILIFLEIDIWLLTFDYWHLKTDIWQLTFDNWHLTFDNWHFLCAYPFCSPEISEWIGEIKRWSLHVGVDQSGKILKAHRTRRDYPKVAPVSLLRHRVEVIA